MASRQPPAKTPRVLSAADPRGMWVPALALLLTVPPPAPYGARILTELQLAVAQASTWVLGLLGVGATRNEFYFATAANNYQIAAVCAGLSSVLAVMALLAIAGWHLGTRPRRLAAVVGCAVVLTLALNIVRIVVLVIVTERFGDFLITSVGHPLFGLVLALAAVAAGLPLLRPRRRASAAPPADATDDPASGQPPTRKEDG